jgi:hypothetical protein
MQLAEDVDETVSIGSVSMLSNFKCITADKYCLIYLFEGSYIVLSTDGAFNDTM